MRATAMLGPSHEASRAVLPAPSSRALISSLQPWVEALFNNEQEGTVRLWVTELFRLVSKSGATLADCGNPEQVAQKVRSCRAVQPR